MTTKKKPVKKITKKPAEPKPKKEMKKLALWVCMAPNRDFATSIIDDEAHETLADARRNVDINPEDVQYLIEFELEVPPALNEASKKVLLKDAGSLKIFKLN